jgi:hypothetical protein
MPNIFLKFFQKCRLFTYVCLANESHKYLNGIIAEATIVDLRLVCQRLHLLHPYSCSQCVLRCNILHTMHVQFFFIIQLIEEGWKNQSHIMFKFFVSWKIFGLIIIFALIAHQTQTFKWSSGTSLIAWEFSVLHYLLLWLFTFT